MIGLGNYAEGENLMVRSKSALIASTLLTALLLAAGCANDSSSSDSPSDGGTGGGGGTTTCTGKVMFITAVTNGNLGGASGADATCAANKPSGHTSSTFKALVGDVNHRTACYTQVDDSCTSKTTGRLDWPMAANTTYCTTGGGTIGATNSYALMNATGTLQSTVAKYFTGFNISWGISNSNNCSDFSSSASGSATAGNANGGFAFATSTSCTSAAYILCVEQ